VALFIIPTYSELDQKRYFVSLHNIPYRTLSMYNFEIRRFPGICDLSELELCLYGDFSYEFVVTLMLW